MNIDRSFDLVIVGGGVAGWTAARRAQDLGADVVVLERTHAGFGFGNGRLSGGAFHAAYLDPQSDPTELLDAILADAGGYARRDLAEAWANNVRRAFEFLKKEGAEFAPGGPEQYMQHVLWPPREAVIGRKFAGSGPDRLLTKMWTTFVENGGTFLADHRAIELDCTDGAVTGVFATAPRGTVRVGGRAVLLADGGFQGNPEMVARYITTDYKLRGSPHDTGDALRMGLAIGAVAVNMEWFYGAPLCRDALNDDRLWPYPTPSGVIAEGLLVDAYGERFVDEATPPELIADAIAKSRTPGHCWAIFDEDTWESTGREGGASINPTLVECGGTIISAPDVDELAAKTGLPPRNLSATIDAFARFCATGAEMTPPKTGRSTPFTSTTLYALPVIAGITFAMGGLLVDPHARVMHRDGAPIAGLYAAGGSMGGLQGGPRSKGYTGGWSEATTFGLLAAEHVMANRA
jgi:fumarate reductase flavoprotein subunit